MGIFVIYINIFAQMTRLQFQFVNREKQIEKCQQTKKINKTKHNITEVSM